MGNGKEKKPPSGVAAFGLGFFATVLVYCVFYLRHFEVVRQFCKDNGVLWIITSLVVLGVIATGSGSWTMFQSPRTFMKAFSIGLGAPAIIFSFDIAKGIGEDAEASTIVASSVTPATVIAITQGGSPILRAIQLALSPNAAVAEHEATAVKWKAEQGFVDERTAMVKELEAVRQDRTILIAQFEREKADFKVQMETLREASDRPPVTADVRELERVFVAMIRQVGELGSPARPALRILDEITRTDRFSSTLREAAADSIRKIRG